MIMLLWSTYFLLNFDPGLLLQFIIRYISAFFKFQKQLLKSVYLGLIINRILILDQTRTFEQRVRFRMRFISALLPHT